MSVGAVSSRDSAASILAQYLAQMATTKKAADPKPATQTTEAASSQDNDKGGTLDLKA